MKSDDRDGEFNGGHTVGPLKDKMDPMRGSESSASDNVDIPSQGRAEAKPSSEVPSKEKTGETVGGRYEILGPLGGAGMRGLYRARDRKVGRNVTLRRLWAVDDLQRRETRRFLQKAEAIRALRHVNVVAVHDLGEDVKGVFLVMEDLRGDDLWHRIERSGKIPVEEALSITKGVGQGLGYAHGKGVVHGRVNPRNVFITENGIPKLLGFELALWPDAPPSPTPGESMEILAYLPPELARGAGRVDSSTDVYGLAQTLYHMITGNVPDSVNLDMVPSHIRPALEQALNPDRSKRTSSVKKFLESLGMPLALPHGPLAPGTVQPGTCVQCGAANPRDERFCQTCGASLFQECPRCHMDCRVGVSSCGSCRVHISRYGEAQTALGRARTHLQNLRYDEALGEARAGLRQGYLGDELKEVMERAAASKKKLAELRAQVTALVNAEQYEDAEGALRSALELDPSQRDLRSLLEELPDRIRQREIVAALAEAELAVNENRFLAALERCEWVLGKQAGHEQALSIKARAEEIREDHDRRVAQIKESLGELQFNKAIELLNGVKADYPWDGEIKDLQARAEARKKSELESLRDKVNELIATERYEDAEAPLRSALELDPSQSDMERLLEELPLRTRERDIRRALEEAEDAIGEKKFPQALERCEWVLGEQSDHGRALGLKEEAKKLQEDHGRRLAEAKTSLDALQFDTALKHFRDLEQDYPWDNSINELMKETESRKKKRLQELRSQAMEAIGEERYEDAEAPLRSALDLDPSQEELQQLLTELPTRVRKRETRRALADAAQALEENRFLLAIERSSRVLQEHPDNEEATKLKTQAESLQEDHRARLADVRQSLEALCFQESLEQLTSLENDFPWDDEVRQLRGEIQARKKQRVDELRSRATELAKQERYEDAEGPLREALTLDTSQKDLQRFLEELPGRIEEREIRRTLAEAAEALQENRFPVTIELCDQVLKKQSRNRQAATLKKQAEKVKESHARKVTQAAESLHASQLNAALQQLGALEREYPWDEEIRKLWQEATTRKENRIQELRAQATELIGEERYSDAEKRLREALNLDASQQDLQDLLKELPTRVQQQDIGQALAEAGKALQEKRFPVALERSNWVLGQDADNKEAAVLKVHAEKLREDYESRLARAKKSLDALTPSNLNEALAELKELEEDYSWDHQVRNLHESATERRKTILQSLRGNAMELVEKGQYEDAEEPLRGALQLDPSQEDLKSLLKELPAKIRDRETRRAVDQAREALKEERFPVAIEETDWVLREKPGDVEAADLKAKAEELQKSAKPTATFGRYEAVARRVRSPATTVWTARPVGSSEPPTYILKVLHPSRKSRDKEAAQAEHDSFLDGVRVQEEVASAEGQHWAPIFEKGSKEGSPFFVTKYYRRSVQWLINRPFRLTGRTLHSIVSAVVEGLKELKRVCHRPHGNLKPSNILIEGQGRITPDRVVLSDPLPAARLAAEASEASDLQALGATICELVLRRPFRLLGGWPVRSSQAWSRLGRQGEAWRKLCDRLLDPDPARSRCSLENVTDALRALETPRRIRTYALAGAAALLVIGVALFILLGRDRPPKIQLIGRSAVTLPLGAQYHERGWRATDKEDGKLTDKLKVSGSVNVNKVGVYRLVYSVRDSSGKRAKAIRTVRVVDRIPPEIVLKGDNRMTLEVGRDRYQEPGWTADDNYDGDISGRVAVQGSVDDAKVGEYTLVYGVRDAGGNRAEEKKRIVQVVDTTVPVLTLEGATDFSLPVGSPYREPGYTARDNYDGDISGRVSVEGTVDSGKMGKYTLVYKVKDSSGNPAEEKIRIVKVVDITAPVVTLLGANPVTMEVGTPYVEPGYTAEDKQDGDLKEKVEVSGSVNTNRLGEYTLTYSVTDSSGNRQEATRTVKVVDTTPPQISLKGDSDVTLEVGRDSYEEPGWTAADNHDGDISSKVAVRGSVNDARVGVYTLTYTVSDSSGNGAEEEKRTVYVVDTTAPVIALKGDTSLTLPVGSRYEEPGYTARDGYDGDVSSKVKVEGTVDSGRIGEYRLVYRVADSSGNSAEAKTRNVKVVDVTEPVLTLLGDNPVTMEVGTTYAEPGYTAEDKQDGDLKEKVEVSGSVNEKRLGEYTLTYTVADSSGNRAQATRTVKVVDTTPPEIMLTGDSRITLEVARDRYDEPGWTAKDNHDGDIASEVAVQGSVDVNKLGDYTLVYSVSDSSGNSADEKRRTIKVVDTTAPVITLEGDPSLTLPMGSRYQEPGYAARDNYDGDIGDRVQVEGVVDSAKLGEYILVYRVTDSSGNSAEEKTRTVKVLDITEPVLTLLGANPMTIEVGDPYAEPGYTAEDKQDGELTDKVKVSGSVDPKRLGEYTLIYSVTNSSGMRGQATRTIKVVDSTPPEITLKGASRMTLEVGRDRYLEPGYTATDNYDGDLTAKVAVEGSVDANKLGEYTLVYAVSDSSGNGAEQKRRVVRVVDTIAPVITLKGDTNITLALGGRYQEPGCSARDNYDGDISERVQIEGAVDSGKLGEYTLLYKVTDSSGNSAEQRTRTVKVVEPRVKFVFLTFWRQYAEDFKDPEKFSEHYLNPDRDAQWCKKPGLVRDRIEPSMQPALLTGKDDGKGNMVFRVDFDAYFRLTSGPFRGRTVKETVSEEWVIAPSESKIIEVRKLD